jgi:uncharacterized protein with GYD domain
LEEKMKIIAVGTYASASHASFIAKPDDDRNAAVKAMVESTGGEVHDLHFLRGKYDFMVILEVKDLEVALALKLLVTASGSVDTLELMETIDFASICNKASKMGAAYRPPGK